MAVVTTSQVAQDIYVLQSLHPDDKLSVTMARLPYTMLTKVIGLAYGNKMGMFTSDREKDTLTLSEYEVKPELVSYEIGTVIDQMIELAELFVDDEQHVSVGQFCVWAQVGPELFPLIKEYAKRFRSAEVGFYELTNPYSDKGHIEEFICTPFTAGKDWGAKQFKKPEVKQSKKRKSNRK